MTIFCITGFSNTSTQLTERVLLACGMSPHLPLERDPTLDIVRWHERVTSSQQLSRQTHPESTERANQPSRLWQQLAIDLMVANMNSNHWGWAHPGAVQWLEFWSQLESEIRFVLVCEDRHSLVCRLVEQGEAPASMAGHLALWTQNHQEMIRFHLRNPAKSLLVWAAEVQTQPTKLIQSIDQNWQTSLNATLGYPQAFEQPTALLQHIALQILSDQPKTAPLDYELQSLIGPAPCPPGASEQIKTTGLIELYGQLKERTILKTQLHQVQDELSAAQHEALAKNKDLQEESDLLLTQLHQVQEELEKYFLLNQEAQEKIKVEIAAKQDVLNQLAAEQKISANRKKQKEDHLAAKHQALARNNDLQKESDLVSAQLQQAKEGLEKISLVNQETQEKIKAETAAKQDALNQLAAEQKISANRKKQKDEQIALKHEALAKNKDLQEKSKLLLPQLHKVQEDLEKYYLQNKEKQIEVQTLQDRWLRAVQSHPELQDFEALELLTESSTELTADWRINQLQVGGVMKGPFEFKTLIENGVAGLVFSKGTKGLSPIHRWPLIAAKDSQLTIIPVNGQDDPKKRSATILQLGTSDWHLVELLTGKLVKALGATAMAQQISHGPALLEALKAQRQILDKVPALLRFDGIQLLGQQNTELKSVIGLRLTHADLQGLKANPFEFQLQLNLTAGPTITSGHLIFDEKTAGKPFENWTHNVKSSAGQAVMALQLGPKGWQPQHWHTLSPLDQQWLQNTIRLLPFMLATLQNQGVKLEKGWSTWLEAATELVNWSKLSVGLPEPTITAKDATPDKLQPPAAAPVPPKAPRKPRQVKAKPAKPASTAKVAPKVPPKVPKKPRQVKKIPSKPAISAKVATKVPQKPKPAKAKPAKPNVSAKVTARVAPKAKRRVT
jgi:chemotaxis protein histidine kinase CheA